LQSSFWQKLQGIARFQEIVQVHARDVESVFRRCWNYLKTLVGSRVAINPFLLFFISCFPHQRDFVERIEKTQAAEETPCLGYNSNFERGEVIASLP
jgi:hypothetical protein